MKYWTLNTSCLLSIALLSSVGSGCDKTDSPASDSVAAVAKAPGHKTPDKKADKKAPANKATGDDAADTKATRDKDKAAAADTAASKTEAPDRNMLPAPSPATQWAPPQVKSWSMPNGLTVWYLKQSQAPLATISLVLPNGGATDPAGKWGLTDLMADLQDEGAGRLKALALSDALADMATDYGAAASTDGLTYEMHLLADKFDESLSLLADIIQRPKFLKAEFARRKAQHIAQAIAAEAQPGQTAVMVMRRALYGQGYGGYSPGGVRSSLESLTLKDVKAQYKAVVAPAGAMLLVVGDVDEQVVKVAINKHFGDWVGSPTAKAAPVSDAPVEAGVHLVHYADAPQTVIYVARRAPDVNDPAVYSAQVFNRVLGGAFVSRLNMNLREDKGYTYGARSQFLRYRRAGVYLHSANVKADTTGPSVVEMRKEIGDIGGDRPITEDEFKAAISGMLLSFPGRFQSMSSVASELAGLWPKGFAPDRLRQWPQQISAVTREQAEAVAKSYADFGDYIVVAAGDRGLIEESLKDLKVPFFVYDAQGERTK